MYVLYLTQIHVWILQNKTEQRRARFVDPCQVKHLQDCEYPAILKSWIQQTSHR